MIATLFLACSPAETWTASVYPDRDNLKDSIWLGSFPTRIECAAAAFDVLARLGSLARGDYECGLNCSRDENRSAVWRCRTTERPLNFGGIPPGAEAAAWLHERCMARVAELYRPEFLTYPFQLKATIGLVSKGDVESYATFTDSAECLSATSTDIVPRLREGPTDFEIGFNEYAKSLGLEYRLSSR